MFKYLYFIQRNTYPENKTQKLRISKNLWNVYEKQNIFVILHFWK